MYNLLYEVWPLATVWKVTSGLPFRLVRAQKCWNCEVWWAVTNVSCCQQEMGVHKGVPLFCSHLSCPVVLQPNRCECFASCSQNCLALHWDMAKFQSLDGLIWTCASMPSGRLSFDVIPKIQLQTYVVARTISCCPARLVKLSTAFFPAYMSPLFFCMNIALHITGDIQNDTRLVVFMLFVCWAVCSITSMQQNEKKSLRLSAIITGAFWGSSPKLRPSTVAQKKSLNAMLRCQTSTWAELHFAQWMWNAWAFGGTKVRTLPVVQL